MKDSTLKTILQIFGLIAVLLTLMPFVAIDYWWIRMFDFPHLQLTFLTLVALLTYFIKFDFKNYRDYILMVILLACFIFQALKIYPYTGLSQYEVLKSSSSKKTLKIYTANVLQDNEVTEKLIKEIESMDADVMVFTETNAFWKDAIKKGLPNEYLYKVEYPLDNTYGMLLYSKLPLINPEIRFLVNDSIPSIHTKIKMHSNDTIQLYAIHPTPPMPQENPKSTDRDSEMMQIALFSRESKHPVVVVGDFNDVAWSETSQLFQRVSELLDLRKGRGLFNTYNANNFLLRWPLDHVFVSKEFRYINAKRGNDIESDHFPFYAELNLEPENADVQKPKPPSAEDIESAKKQIKKQERADNELIN